MGMVVGADAEDDDDVSEYEDVWLCLPLLAPLLLYAALGVVVVCDDVILTDADDDMVRYALLLALAGAWDGSMGIRRSTGGIAELRRRCILGSENFSLRSMSV